MLPTSEQRSNKLETSQRIVKWSSNGGKREVKQCLNDGQMELKQP